MENTSIEKAAGDSQSVVAGIDKKDEVITLSIDERKKIDEIKNSIDLTDTQQVIQFGIETQKEISGFSENILNQVRAKDAGQVGEVLTSLMLKVKDMDVSSFSGSKNFWSKIPVIGQVFDGARKFVAKYEKLDVQVDKIADELDAARMGLLRDIGMFDALYEKNLEYFRALSLYILAGEEKLKEMQTTIIEAARATAQKSGDALDAQKVSDLENLANRFEKKLYDLKLSKTIALQTAPQIRLIQNNNSVLVDKIQTSILNTIPLWKSQIVIALGIFRQQKALEVQRNVTDTTNDLLKANSALLKQNTIGTATESERGIVDIETLKKVNLDLIETIEETIRIQKEGSIKRKAAENEIENIEKELKAKLISLKS